MNKQIWFVIVCLALGMALTPAANADLDGFLGNLNVQAGVDLPGFKGKISGQFGIPVPRVQGVIDIVPTPADAFMCFQVGLMTGRSPQAVAEIFNHNRQKGWGAMAKELGIKPGSAEFKALKRGDFELTGQPRGKTGRSHGKSQQGTDKKGKNKK